MTHQQLLQLASGMAASGPASVGSLAVLQQMLGSWHAAAEAVLSNPALQRLPTGPEVDRIAAGLGAAGLSHEQLLELARAAVSQPDQLHKFTTLAERLYSGDWRGAALKFLAERQALERCLCSLRPALNELRQLGLRVVNERGRERVLWYIEGKQDSMGWSMAIPPGTPAAKRRAAAAAALKAEGFRATGKVAKAALDRLVVVSGGWVDCRKRWTD